MAWHPKRKNELKKKGPSASKRKANTKKPGGLQRKDSATGKKEDWEGRGKALAKHGGHPPPIQEKGGAHGGEEELRIRREGRLASKRGEKRPKT